MVPIEEQIENSSLYYEESIKTWFLFTNQIGIDRGEYTDAIWVYWSKDPNRWDPKKQGRCARWQELHLVNKMHWPTLGCPGRQSLGFVLRCARR